MNPSTESEAEREAWILSVAQDVKGGELEQPICDILAGFADIVYHGAPGERDPEPFIADAVELVFDHLREEYPDRPEADLREAAETALQYYEVW